MKKLFFLLTMIIITAANAKAQRETKKLFPNKEAEIQALKAKETAKSPQTDATTPTKQRLFQNYNTSSKKAATTARLESKKEKTASDQPATADKKEEKTVVKTPPTQQEAGAKQ